MNLLLNSLINFIMVYTYIIKDKNAYSVKSQ